MGEILTLVIAFLWAGMGLIWAIAAGKKLSMLPMFAVMATVASLPVAVFHLRLETSADRGGGIGLTLLLVAGIVAYTAATMSGESMKASPSRTAVAWAVYQMCMVMPFLSATLRWGEQAGWYRWLALVAVGGALALLAPASSKSASAKDWVDPRWFRLVIGAFLLNGLGQCLIQETTFRGWHGGDYYKAFLITGPVAVVFWLICVARKEWKPGQWALGTLGGLLAVIANILMFRALTFLDLEHRKYLFFPMAVGGCILIYTVYQLLTGRETFSVRKLAGVGVGSVGIALLGMKV